MTPLLGKVLVANRGEIARRIFRSCRELGIGTVAICSEADLGAAHVMEADEHVCIGPAPARDSYLIASKVLEAARQTGADAIHPGYGFLSENADFARAVQAADLIWIGPEPDTIDEMGNKQAARGVAEAANVPVVPGSPRFTDDLTGIEAAAAAVGYPLLVKASAGGGGIGMRRVDSPEKLRAVAEATGSMAAKAFGDGTIYFERFIPAARHVEVQVFGFGNGEAIHLYERDCSLQRRFQKVIEESPAPGLPDAIRDQMVAAALRLCRKTRYAGAGTIEFIYDIASTEFFFLEMNTRVQVEHPVTEAVTGQDIVALQILQAAGKLPVLPQSQITTSGHAIECRIYAEDPARNFLPSPGQICTYREPTPRHWLRVDAAYRQGDTVTPFYDPMIAKLIAHGATREDARANALTALAEFVIEGPKTNLDLLRACLADPDVIAGTYDTAFLEARRAEMIAARPSGLVA